MSRVVTNSRNIDFSEEEFKKVCKTYGRAIRRRRHFKIRTTTGRWILIPANSVIRIEQ
jgi:hypothetical protein